MIIGTKLTVLRKAARVLPSVWALHPRGCSGWSSRLLALVWISPGCFSHLGSEPAHQRPLLFLSVFSPSSPLFLPVTLSNKQNFKNKNI